MTMTRRKVPLILAILLMAATTATPVSVQADPLGQLVNLIMNKILDDAAKKEDEAKHVYESSNPSAYRNIPKNSKHGTLSPTQNGREIEIDGDRFHLAFNSRIRDESNRVVQTGMIRDAKRIRYTLNNQNEVEKIWLLAPNEH